MLDKLFEVNAWLSYLISTLAILAAAEVGRLTGVATRRRGAEAMSTEIATQSASPSLLALTIGFTFSMTLTLNEARKENCAGRSQCDPHDGVARPHAA